ncbi:MAG: V-type ATPase 116kDa subunit family protein [Nitriliruptoraceae bacterium]
MRRSDHRPTPMARVAVVAPRSRRREALVELAASGHMEFEELDDHPSDEVEQLRREVPGEVEPLVSVDPPDLDQLRERGDWARVAGEVELLQRAEDAIEHGPAVVFVGWVPEPQVPELTQRLADHGVSLTTLPRPRSVVPPTRMAGSALHGSLRPLVRTYAVVPYEDVDPTIFAGATYVLMFGMMFGDVGHGFVLAVLGGLLARSRHPRLATVRRLWPFPVAAGLVAMVFGLLYGEAFGPTGLVPTLWLAPLDEPVRLLIVAVGAGAVLIGASYLIGTVNRLREGGFGLALFAPTGLAGFTLFLGAAVAAAGLAWDTAAVAWCGALLAGVGLLLSFVGLLSAAGTGGAAIGQAVIELFDLVVRVFANVVSFGRLAAFGLTHAAIGAVVWQGTTALWRPGPAAIAAVALFIVGHSIAFALEALVIGVQALRLEFYELFSRIFTGEGRLFHPWHPPVESKEAT